MGVPARLQPKQANQKQQQNSLSVYRLSMFLIILWTLPTCFGWYTTSHLSSCASDQPWNVTIPNEDEPSPIKLGPVVASPPYTEGEFYSVEKRNVAVECHIESAPEDSLVILTYNSSYMDNMKTLIPTHRSNDTGNDIAADQGMCTILLYNATTLKQLELPMVDMPPACPSEQVNSGKMMSSTIRLTISKIKINQTGTHQCSILRRCHPSPKANDADSDEEEPLVAITKSLFMKVYGSPDYQPDLLVALSGLAVTSVVFLVSVTVERTASRGSDNQ